MSDTSRRKLLKSIAAGSGAIVAGKSLPDSWNRPVVDTVILPAHARTSLMSSSGEGQVTRAAIDSESDSLLARTISNLIPEARAGAGVSGGIFICVRHVSDTHADFEAMVVYGEVCDFSYRYFASNVPVGNETDMEGENLCDVMVDNGSVLDKLGLIKEANAWIGTGGAKLTIETLNGPLGGAKGSFVDIDNNLFTFDLPREECPGFIPVCTCNNDM